MTGAEGITYCTIKIDDSKCQRCLECVNNCPAGALSYHRACFMHDSYSCSYDEVCMDICPNAAITIVEM